MRRSAPADKQTDREERLQFYASAHNDHNGITLIPRKLDGQQDRPICCVIEFYGSSEGDTFSVMIEPLN